MPIFIWDEITDELTEKKPYTQSEDIAGTWHRCYIRGGVTCYLSERGHTALETWADDEQAAKNLMRETNSVFAELHPEFKLGQHAPMKVGDTVTWLPGGEVKIIYTIGGVEPAPNDWFVVVMSDGRAQNMERTIAFNPPIPQDYWETLEWCYGSFQNGPASMRPVAILRNGKPILEGANIAVVAGNWHRDKEKALADALNAVKAKYQPGAK